MNEMYDIDMSISMKNTLPIYSLPAVCSTNNYKRNFSQTSRLCYVAKNLDLHQC